MGIDESAFRRGLSERENHVIDEFRHNGLSRREFIRYASIAGMSVPIIGAFAGGTAAEAATKK